MNQIDLVGRYSEMFDAFPGLQSVMRMLGVGLVVFGVFRFAISQVSGRPPSGVAPALFFGTAMAVPEMLLSLVQWVISTIFNTLGLASAIEPEVQPTLKPIPEPAPADSTLDASFVWIIVGVLAAIVVVCAGAFLVGVFAAKRRRLNEARTLRASLWGSALEVERVAMLRMAAYETDPALAIDYPAFNDTSEPAVRAMTKALRHLQAVRSAMPADADKHGSWGTEQTLERYADAAHEFHAAVDDAERMAKRTAWSQFTVTEQKDLRLAKKLLAQAGNPGNPAVMRANLYRQLATVIGRLNASGIQVPEKITAALEASNRLQIEGS